MSEQTALQQVAEDQLVTFCLGGENLAFPIGLVQEIVKPSAITRVPNAPPYVEGIANLRGNILPVVNLRNRLGMNLKGGQRLRSAARRRKYHRSASRCGGGH